MAVFNRNGRRKINACESHSPRRGYSLRVHVWPIVRIPIETKRSNRQKVEAFDSGIQVLGQTEMPRRLSSVLTFFWKFIFPVLWFSGSGVITVLAFTESQGFTHRDLWVSPVSWALSCFLCFLLQTVRLKRVRMDGEFLYLSNYLRQAKVPLCDVWSVGVLTVRVPLTKGLGELALKPFVVVEFQGETPFGNRIVFAARGIFVAPEPWTHPVVQEIRQAVDRALLGSMKAEEFTPRDLGRAREGARKAKAQLLVPAGPWGRRPSKPTLRLQVRFVRRSILLWNLFGIPGGGLLVALVLAAIGARAAIINSVEDGWAATGVSGAILIGFTLLLGARFVQTLRFSLTTPARLVPYFERPLDAKKWGAFKKTSKMWDFGASSEPLDASMWEAFKRGFALARGFDALECRASELGVTPLSVFGFGDDMLGQVVVWHSAGGGLKTVRALVASCEPEALDPKLLEDLQALEAVLERAETAGVRFAMVVRISSDEWIAHAEMVQRKGSFW